METYKILDRNEKLVKPKNWPEADSENAEQLPVVSFVDFYHGDNDFFINAIQKSTKFSWKEAMKLEKETEEKGIKLIKKPSPEHDIIILDIENSSSLNLLKRFSFASIKSSSAILMSIWFKSISKTGGEEQIFLETLFKGFISADHNTFNSKTLLIFCVHDFDKDIATEKEVEGILNQRVSKLWKTISEKEGKEIENPFEISIISFSHYKYEYQSYNEKCEIISQMISKEGVIISNKKYQKTTTIEKIFQELTVGAEFEEKEASENQNNNNDNINQIYQVDETFSDVLKQAAGEMIELSKIVDQNNKIPKFGKKATEIMENALETFDTKTGNFSDRLFVKKKKNEIEAILDTSLMSIFLKQISVLREEAIGHFKSATVNEDVPVDFAFFTADSFFVRESEDSIRPDSYWNYSAERTNVHNAIKEISNRRKQLISEKIQHAEHQANAFQYLQMQQAQMQAIQQQQYGGGTGNWNIGAAYRPPDSNLNISMGYQQGRTNIQISMVPDEQASLLGPNGFTAGVGPANLGLSLNLNL